MTPGNIQVVRNTCCDLLPASMQDGRQWRSARPLRRLEGYTINTYPAVASLFAGGSVDGARRLDEPEAGQCDRRTPGVRGADQRSRWICGDGQVLCPKRRRLWRGAVRIVGGPGRWLLGTVGRGAVRGGHQQRCPLRRSQRPRRPTPDPRRAGHRRRILLPRNIFPAIVTWGSWPLPGGSLQPTAGSPVRPRHESIEPSTWPT